MAKHLIFCYGSLKQGMMRNGVLNNQRYIGVAVTEPSYGMFQLSGYPAMIDKTHAEGEKLVGESGKSIYGELYEVDGESIGQLDKIEGVGTNLYERRAVKLAEVFLVGLPTSQEVFSAFQEKKAESYFYKKPIGGAKNCGSFWSQR